MLSLLRRLGSLATMLLFLQACGSTPVAVSCPPPAPLPPELKQEAEELVSPTPPALYGATLMQDFAQHYNDFLEELRQAFSEATEPLEPSPPVSPGRSEAKH